MRYTAGAAMDEKGMRDVERWKDKIEVRLDNRQVAFLFFGSALVACLLFVLGVIVGKRIESRGHALAPEIEDPLALLDRVAATGRGTTDNVILPRGLLGVGAGGAGKPKVTRVPAPAATGAAPVPVVQAGKAEKVAKVEKEEISAGPPDIKKGHYTLQLKAFSQRPEAEAFARQFRGANAYILPVQIPDQGTWYRVRIGDYTSAKEAVAAKSAFEKKHSVIGYVVGPL